MEQHFYDAVEGSPVIAAVKDFEGLEKACGLEEVQVIFILFGDICNIASIVKRVKDAGKIAMVHMDLIIGLSSKEVVVDYIKQATVADGIITTKPTLVKRAKELKLYTVLRYFLIDSMALENIRQQPHNLKPDFIEVLPGGMPKLIQEVCNISKVPVIAGGLIGDKEAVMGALTAGAIAVSTTNPDVWLV